MLLFYKYPIDLLNYTIPD